MKKNWSRLYLKGAGPIPYCYLSYHHHLFHKLISFSFLIFHHLLNSRTWISIATHGWRHISSKINLFKSLTKCYLLNTNLKFGKANKSKNLLVKKIIIWMNHFIIIINLNSFINQMILYHQSWVYRHCFVVWFKNRNFFFWNTVHRQHTTHQSNTICYIEESSLPDRTHNQNPNNLMWTPFFCTT